MFFARQPISLAIGALTSCAAFAQGQPGQASSPIAQELATVTVEASADASAAGLSKPFAGGHVARGGRVGVLGTQDSMDTPFSIKSYTRELIADQQAQSVGDVLLNDPSVRQARGFGNFQEVYVVRGFPLFSDDIAYNGLYGMLPRQYVASEFFERVEILLGANAFLNGAAPGGSGQGGSVNLLPKRAVGEPLSQVSAGVQTGGQAFGAMDLSRRFGPDDSTGIRLNAVRRDGETSIDNEKRELTALSLGVDWRSRDIRLSADLGYQDNELQRGRPSVTPGTTIPAVPDARGNYAQPWSYSSEKDLFGTVRAEWDISPQVTTWVAGGMRRSQEKNSLSSLTLTNASGASTGSRFDNRREDDIKTGEVGMRGEFVTGPIGHQITASAMLYDAEERNAWGMGSTSVTNNLYAPWGSAPPPLSLFGGNLNDPLRVGATRHHSFALADTLSFLEDRIRLTLGLRHQTIKQTSYQYTTGALTDTYSKSLVTPAVGFVFKPLTGVSFYANYIEGLAKGEVAPVSANGLPVLNAGQVFAPYRTKQKEIGAKWERDRLGATLALFETDKPSAYVKDQVFDEYGKQRNRGVELSLYGEPLRGLRLLGGLTLLSAKQQGTPNGVNDGRYAIGVPKRQLSLGADWDVPGVQGLALNARVVHTSSQYANAANTLSVDSWTRTDIGARYLVPIGQARLLTLRARVDNVFGKNYWASVGGFPGSNYLVQAAPRTFALTATLDF
jgi:iron complex outermembrane receptor protein